MFEKFCALVGTACVVVYLIVDFLRVQQCHQVKLMSTFITQYSDRRLLSTPFLA